MNFRPVHFKPPFSVASKDEFYLISKEIDLRAN